MLEDSKSNDHLFSIYENYRRVDGLTLYPVICERRKKAAAAAILSEHARNNTSEFCVLILGGSLLSLNAGFINAVSYLVSRIYVSHTTGSVTSAAVLLDSNELFGFGALLLLVGCFLLGSFITTLLISDQNFYVGRAYNRVFLIGSGILLVAAIVQIVFHESSAYCYFSSCACGMQNAMTTKYSGSVLRTTHTTGLVTDIGISLGRICKNKVDQAWKLKLQVPLLLSFFIGGFLGARTYSSLRQYSSIVNFLLFFGTGLLYTLCISTVRGENFCKSLLMGDDLEVAHEPGDESSAVISPIHESQDDHGFV